MREAVQVEGAASGVALGVGLLVAGSRGGGAGEMAQQVEA